MWKNKSLWTNLIALGLSVVGTLCGWSMVQTIGFYALSGAITNWLAIYMLFERVPFLYGSGIIPRQFEGFKRAIKNMMMSQFFTKAHMQNFVHQVMPSPEAQAKMIKSKINYDQLFDGFVDAIMESQFGGMISSFLGGKEALMPMKDSFTQKLEKVIDDMLAKAGNGSDDAERAFAEKMSDNIEQMIDARLEKLTPKMVKEIIQEMIRRHLGWLVVWGGVFGGIIGCVANFLHH